MAKRKRPRRASAPPGGRRARIAQGPRSAGPGAARGTSPGPDTSRGPAPAGAARAARPRPPRRRELLPGVARRFIWDDEILVKEQVIHAWTGLWNIWRSPADITREGHYWPVVYTTFWLEHKLWGLAPEGYHAVNVLLHMANVALVWRLLARLAVPGAWLAAAIFAVHPLHVESVAWIIERKDLLSALFYLGAAHAWLRFAEAPRAGRYALALGLFVAGMLSKAVVVTLPAALLLWHWWRQGRITALDVARLAPFFAVGLGIALADYAFYRSVEAVDLGYGPLERALIAARALWFYACKLVWPRDLAVIYPLWDVSVRDAVGWVGLAAALALAVVLWRGRARWGRGPLFGAAFFAVTLSPTLGLVEFGYMQFSFVADRFQYLAGLGLLAVLVGAAVHAARKIPARPSAAAALPALAAVLVVVLAVLTWRQCGIYRDPVTFFSHIVAHNERARHAHYNLARALLDAGRLEESAAASRTATQLEPGNTRAWQNLGQALRVLGRDEEAAGAYRAALAIDPRYAPAHSGSARCCSAWGAMSRRFPPCRGCWPSSRGRGGPRGSTRAWPGRTSPSAGSTRRGRASSTHSMPSPTTLRATRRWPQCGSGKGGLRAPPRTCGAPAAWPRATAARCCSPARRCGPSSGTRTR